MNFCDFCSERDHKPQNSGCGYTAQSFHKAWSVSRRDRAVVSRPAAAVQIRLGRCELQGKIRHLAAAASGRPEMNMWRAVLNCRPGLTGESERVAFAAAARILWVVDGSGTVHSEAPSLGGCI
jgi:hypothetical protein